MHYPVNISIDTIKKGLSLVVLCILPTGCSLVSKQHLLPPEATPSASGYYVLHICNDTQQYVRNVRILPQQACIIKGQGVALSSSYVLTAKHVVQDLTRSYRLVDAGGEIYTVASLWHHPTLDLAVIKTQTTISPVISSLSTNETILATGTSVFSSTALEGMLIAHSTGLYTTTFTLYPSDSGSPVFDSDEHLVAINVAMRTDGTYSYAIPITSRLLHDWFQEIDLDLSQ